MLSKETSSKIIVARFGITLLAGELVAFIVGAPCRLLIGEEFAIWCIVDILYEISMNIRYPTGGTEVVIVSEICRLGARLLQVGVDA